MIGILRRFLGGFLHSNGLNFMSGQHLGCLALGKGRFVSDVNVIPLRMLVSGLNLCHSLINHSPSNISMIPRQEMV